MRGENGWRAAVAALVAALVLLVLSLAGPDQAGRCDDTAPGSGPSWALVGAAMLAFAGALASAVLLWMADGDDTVWPVLLGIANVLAGLAALALLGGVDYRGC